MGVNIFEGQKAERLASSLETIANHLENLANPEAIAEDVTAWLDENITNPDSPPLDRSLQVAQAAAPADLVGDLKSALNNSIAFDCTDGYYIKATGDSASNGESCITDYIDVVPGQNLKLSGLYVAGQRAVCAYDADKIFSAVIISGSSATIKDYTVPNGVYYIRATGAYGIPPTVKMVDICSSVTEMLGMVNDTKDLKVELPRIDNNVYDGFIEFGVPTLPTQEHLKPYKDIGSNNLPADNSKTMLVYDVPVKTGWKIIFTDYTGYKYFMKYWNGSVWGNYKSIWYTDDYTFTENVRLSVYIRNTSESDLSDIDIETIIGRFKLANTVSDLVVKIDDLQNDVNESSAVKTELPRIDENVVNGFIEFGIPTLTTENHLLPYKDIGSDNLLADNTTTMLIYDVPVKTGWKIHFTDYTGYKYFLKWWSNNTWANYKSSWYTEDFTFTEDIRLTVYIRNTAGTDLSDADIETIISRFKVINTASELNNRINDLEWKTEYNYGTDFINNFIPSSALQLPSYYADFPIDITISRYGKLYGHNLVPSMFTKNNESGATYYVSPEGNDSNDGASSSNPLKSIDAAVAKSDVNTIILMPGIYERGTHFSSMVSKEINIIGENKAILLSKDSESPLKFTKGCYVENVIFYGGTSACDTVLDNELIVFNRCVFTKSSQQNGLTALGGYYILFDCIADDNMLDGFNYHANSSYKPQVVEIRCKGKLNGHRSNLTQNNGSTIHDTNSRIIRIGCEYASCRGGVVADANNAFSVNIVCKSGSTEAVSETNRNGNYVVMGNAIMWLYDCASFGSPYDIIADTGYIYTTDTYQRESSVNGGVINRLS